ncbi:MAG TPA: winged helix-turn-helix transcriptional regulator, partial [Alphaproteobacteria bacterium]|nr:winged helix-turn-helix transcriptional regulator [Alphaproteobacteria bacterium]
YAICLSEIARNEGCSLTDLSEKTGLALSTVSRIVGALSSYRQKGIPYEFITMKISETERRKKELFLTDKGREALNNILAVL